MFYLTQQSVENASFDSKKYRFWKSGIDAWRLIDTNALAYNTSVEQFYLQKYLLKTLLHQKSIINHSEFR